MNKSALICVYILKILREYTNSSSGLTQSKILDILYKKYDIKIVRKTLSHYLNSLISENLIEKNKGYKILNSFSDEEIRIIVDAILYSSHIPKKIATSLIEKLDKLSPKSLKRNSSNMYYVKNLKRVSNENLYGVLNKLDYAIKNGKKVKIHVQGYNENFELEKKYESIINPYNIILSNSRYYVVCYAGRNSRLENRRIDYIINVDILEEQRIPISDIKKEYSQIDMSEYIKKHIYLFSGDIITVHLKLNKKNIGVLIDVFGDNYKIIKKYEDNIVVKIDISENSIYFILFQYIDIFSVVYPDYVVKNIINKIKNNLEKYNNILNDL